MNNLILVDTREKGHKKILEYFDKVGQEYITTKLDSGDYMLYKNYNVLIDRKDSILELAGNLCKTSEHYRVVREIQRAKELGCKRFIFLVADQKITCVDEVENWTSKYSKVKGSTLQKILNTMSQKYEVEFQFVKKSEMPSKIIALLTNK